MNPDETAPCSCGRRGCLEQYASATGLVRLAQKAVAAKVATTLPPAGLTARQIVAAAQSGDAAALMAIDQMSKALGGALADIAAVCDPQVFVIGGGLSKAGSFLIDKVRQHYRSTVFGDMVHTPIRMAALQNDAGIYGAAGLLLNAPPAKYPCS